MLVAQGCSQKYIVYDTYAPIVRHSTLSLLLSLNVQIRFLVYHVDVVAAHLNGDLEDEVYMVQPKFFEQSLVCRLKKSL